MFPCRWSGPLLVALLVVGQVLVVQSGKIRKRSAVLPSGSTAGLPDLDSFGFREFILRAGNDRIVDFPDGGPEATIAQIIPANLLNTRRRRMVDLVSQREAVARDRSLMNAEDDMGASSEDNGRSRQMEPTKLRTASIEVHPTRTSMTFPIRGLTSMSSATVALVDLYPVTRSPFPVICRGTGTVNLGEMSAAAHLDPGAQPKIYTADVTACLTAAHEAGLDEVRIEMALPCRERCLFAEEPFLVLQ